MKQPNFFILGSPKCGTTSLASWLGMHEQVFMSELKEPHFFNTDSAHRGVLDLAAYEQLFATADSRHLAVGEASVWYLVSNDAVRNILRYNAAAKFIVCVRNPVEMAVSLHYQERFSGDEPIADFHRAWLAQVDRSTGRSALPSTCMDINHLMYGPSCKHGALLQRLYESVSRDNVLVVLMDDMKADPSATYRRALNFLGVPDDSRKQFPVANRAKQRKFALLQKAARSLWLWKQKKGYQFSLGVGNKIQIWNRQERPSDIIPPDVTAMLSEYFADDVHLFGQMLDRDLTHWL